MTLNVEKQQNIVSEKNTLASENNQLRANIYQLLAALLRQAPDQNLINFLVDLEVETETDNAITKAWHSLKLAAIQSTIKQIENEYFTLFIGIGCGEILPYASWFTTSSLMNKPLALLRQDLRQLGYERNENVSEPEDHIAAIFEVMASLIIDEPAYRQLAFYQRHIETWINHFCEDLSSAPSANFYATLAQLAKAFFELEALEFEQLKLNTLINFTLENNESQD